MNDYKKRGRNELIMAAIHGLLSILLLCFEKTRDFGFCWIVFTIPYLIAFVVRRRMTPEQFKEKQRQANIANDERKTAIMGKACHFTCFVMLYFLMIGFAYFYFFTENSAAAYALGGQWLILIIVLLGSYVVLKRKM